MAGPYTAAMRSCEAAVAGAISRYLVDEIDGWTVYTAGSRGALTVPRIHVVADSCIPSIQATGIITAWTIELGIGCVSDTFDTTSDAHNDVAGYLQDFILRGDIVEIINNSNDASNWKIYAAPYGWEAGAASDDFGEEQQMSGVKVIVRGICDDEEIL